jgi:Cytochrome c oxidase subunit III
LTLAIGLGGVFVAIKLVEYANEIAAGAGFETGTFFTLYFLLTGFHLLHVVLGMVMLAVVLRAATVPLCFCRIASPCSAIARSMRSSIAGWPPGLRSSRSWQSMMPIRCGEIC